MHRSFIALLVAVALLFAVIAVECGPARGGRRRARTTDDVNDLFPDDGNGDQGANDEQQQERAPVPPPNVADVQQQQQQRKPERLRGVIKQEGHHYIELTKLLAHPLMGAIL